MRILTLEAHNFRNFQHIEVGIDSNYNILYGENGSGKTSFLEAIHYLGLGRSFRTHLGRRVIKDESDKFSIFALLKNCMGQTTSLGIEKTTSGDTKIKLQGNNTSIMAIAELLPIQLLNNDSFCLLTDGPQPRRQFLDWGLFHVKQSFIDHWKKYQQALRQRNFLLRQQAPKQQIQVWDSIIAKAGEVIAAMRKEYIEQWQPLFLGILADVYPLEQLILSYQQGWPDKQTLEEVLAQAFTKDFELGYTYYGIHRADLSIKFQKTPAADVLSRGQQKIFVWAMRIAQSILLKQCRDKDCIYLIDDLPSELDPIRRLAMINMLKETNSQIFVTGLVKDELSTIISPNQGKMFHVKHGVITEDLY